MTDQFNDGNFYWQSLIKNSEISYTNWGPNEPNGGKSENCVLFWTSSGGWNDWNCENTASYVCEIVCINQGRLATYNFISYMKARSFISVVRTRQQFEQAISRMRTTITNHILALQRHASAICCSVFSTCLNVFCFIPDKSSNISHRRKYSIRNT